MGGPGTRGRANRGVARFANSVLTTNRWLAYSAVRIPPGQAGYADGHYVCGGDPLRAPVGCMVKPGGRTGRYSAPANAVALMTVR